MSRPAKIPAALLIRDDDFWPRATIDSRHVNGMVETLLAGGTLPPVVADRKSRRIIDGVHRKTAHLRAFGDDAEIEVFWKTYSDDAAMFEEAVALNAAHGRRLTSFDHARIAKRFEELGVAPERVAALLHLRVATLKKKKKYGILKNGDRVALKRPLRYLDGEELADAQAEYNEKSSGWPPSFHAHQLVLALSAGIPEISETFAATLLELVELIDALDIEVAA